MSGGRTTASWPCVTWRRSSHGQQPESASARPQLCAPREREQQPPLLALHHRPRLEGDGCPTRITPAPPSRAMTQPNRGAGLGWAGLTHPWHRPQAGGLVGTTAGRRLGTGSDLGHQFQGWAALQLQWGRERPWGRTPGQRRHGGGLGLAKAAPSEREEQGGVNGIEELSSAAGLKGLLAPLSGDGAERGEGLAQGVGGAGGTRIRASPICFPSVPLIVSLGLNLVAVPSHLGFASGPASKEAALFSFWSRTSQPYKTSPSLFLSCSGGGGHAAMQSAPPPT